MVCRVWGSDYEEISWDGGGILLWGIVEYA